MEKLKKRKSELDGSKLLNIEKKIILENVPRLNFITDMIASTTKTGLVLFHNVQDGYGKRIYEMLRDKMDNSVSIYYVDGNTPKNVREEYKRCMEENENQSMMVASYGTYSTGIDISTLEYIYLTESFKSEVIIKQSFGRGMRLMDGKKVVNIVDFVDDYSLPGFENYILGHARSREELYKRENFKYTKHYIKF